MALYYDDFNKYDGYFSAGHYVTNTAAACYTFTLYSLACVARARFANLRFAPQRSKSKICVVARAQRTRG